MDNEKKEGKAKRVKRDHLDLLCDIGDLADLLWGSENIEGFLQKTVEMVAKHFDADVSSIYLYQRDKDELVMAATVGLNPQAVGRVRLKMGEGLVGTTLAEGRPVCEHQASKNPRFRYFKEADEERFESFLAVPIQRGDEKIGVLVVQHGQSGYFREKDIYALRVSASQLAGSIDNARLVMDLRGLDLEGEPPPSPVELGIVKGESASGGYAFAPVVVYRRKVGRFSAPPSKEDRLQTYSLEEFNHAVQMTSNQLKEMQAGFSRRLPESASLIFTAHFMILKDPGFVGRMREMVEEGISPPDAVREITGKYLKLFSSSPHAHMQEKANDVEDLGNRILNNLTGQGKKESSLGSKRIVVARELFPSDILKLASEDVRGIILVGGGITSHISILVRSLGIPMVITENKKLQELSDGTEVLLDADQGNIYVAPSDEVIANYEQRNRTRKTVSAVKDSMLPETRTRDGVRVALLANINLLNEIPLALDLCAEGVGLYRTEFPFIVRTDFPTEEEQYVIYKRLIDNMAGRMVTIRTLDAGGDKRLSYYDPGMEENPALGLRSIRFSLKRPDIFEQQIRAILRAGCDCGRLRIMFPMISSLDEFREAKNMVEACMGKLEEEGVEFHGNPEIGMMVELPAVVETIEEFAREADFFSIGTNDFVQYMLGVDRGNKAVADYFQPHHPSVLRALARIVRAAVAGGIDVSVCGEMAHELEYIPFLLGIGIRSLSVNPQALPSVQQRIMGLEMEDVEKHAAKLLAAEDLQGTRGILDQENPGLSKPLG